MIGLAGRIELDYPKKNAIAEKIVLEMGNTRPTIGNIITYTIHYWAEAHLVDFDSADTNNEIDCYHDFYSFDDNYRSIEDMFSISLVLMYKYRKGENYSIRIADSDCGKSFFPNLEMTNEQIKEIAYLLLDILNENSSSLGQAVSLRQETADSFLDSVFAREEKETLFSQYPYNSTETSYCSSSIRGKNNLFKDDKAKDLNLTSSVISKEVLNGQPFSYELSKKAYIECNDPTISTTYFYRISYASLLSSLVSRLMYSNNCEEYSSFALTLQELVHAMIKVNLSTSTKKDLIHISKSAFRYDIIDNSIRSYSSLFPSITKVSKLYVNEYRYESCVFDNFIIPCTMEEALNISNGIPKGARGNRISVSLDEKNQDQEARDREAGI